jgi:hypothetical protein
MPRTQSSVVINRPVEEVFDFAMTLSNHPLWMRGVIEARQTSEGPLGVGSTGRLVERVLGRRVEAMWEITEYEQNRAMTAKSTLGPVSLVQQWGFEAVAGGTKVSLDQEIGLGRVLERLAGPPVAWLLRREWQSALVRLKTLLEARAEEGA